MGVNKERKIHNDNKYKNSRRDNGKVPFTDFRFVRLELTEAEKNEFRELYSAGEFEALDIDGWLEAGYKLSLTKGDAGATVVATLSGQYRDMLDGGLLLTGRGSSVALALAVLSFKHNTLADEDGWLAAEDRRGGTYSDIG